MEKTKKKEGEKGNKRKKKIQTTLQHTRTLASAWSCVQISLCKEGVMGRGRSGGGEERESKEE